MVKGTEDEYEVSDHDDDVKRSMVQIPAQHLVLQMRRMLIATMIDNDAIASTSGVYGEEEDDDNDDDDDTMGRNTTTDTDDLDDGNYGNNSNDLGVPMIEVYNYGFLYITTFKSGVEHISDYV